MQRTAVKYLDVSVQVNKMSFRIGFVRECVTNSVGDICSVASSRGGIG